MFRVPSRQITEEWARRQLVRLGSNEELAFHSRVYAGDTVYHVPLVDFLGPFDAPFVKGVLKPLIEQVRSKICFFSSGRSLHAYMLSMFLPDYWTRFMGALLLVQTSDGRPVVDYRWVGHSLINGFGALRWSRNTKLYLQVPELVGEWPR